MRGLRPLLLLLLLLLLSLLSPCSAHESASAALFHDRSPLLALEELTEVSSAVADERTRWGLSDNVAHYLGLRRLLSFSLPVHVNLIFIGFHGDGNGFLTLNQADFAAWFEHMEHELEHVVAPVGETQTTTDENETPDSSVRYRFLVDVLHLSPLVNTIVEDTIVWGLASEEPPEADQPDDQHTDDHGEYHYADAMRMSGLLRDLLIHLNLTNSYTFFVLNPKNPVGHGETYGYRYGFSDEDIEVVRQHAHEIRVEWPPPKPAPRKSNLTADVESKLEFRDLFAESEKWANEYIAQFRIAKEPVDCSSEQWSENIRCRTRPGAGRSVMERADLISHYGTLEEKRYLQRILDLNATVNEQCLTDVWISRERFAFLDLTAGPFSWGPNVAGEGVRTEETLPRVPVSSAGAPAKAYAGAKAEATELTEAIEKYKSHCSMMHPDSDPNEKLSPYCSDLMRRIETLEKAEAKKHTEDWASQLVGSDEEGEADPADSVEQVMWRLSATLANGVRALLAPPSGLYSTPLTSHIVFQAIVVTNPGLPYKISDHFKWEMFKEQITSLGLPGQDITFTFNEQSLSIASELSMAFRLSLRTHVIPTLNSEGGFKATPQTFVDSHVFRDLLGPRNLRTSATVPVVTNSSGELRLRTSLVQRTIPIYVFAVGTEYGPLLVDRYYQAKALSDMVVVVMSDFSDYESRLSCNGQAIYWDLRDPLKALLSATGLVLGGLVPLHVGYNHPRHRTTQDWLWSVGDSPLSHTSSGARFNQIQRDIVHRNYIREHVDAALAQMDEAIEWLVEEATEDSDYDYVAPTLTLYWTELRELYATVTGTLSALGREVAHVDFAAAAPLVPKLDSAVASFHALAQHVSGLSHLFRCSARTAVATEKAAKSINWGVIAALVLLDASVVAMALFALKRKRKIKVN